MQTADIHLPSSDNTLPVEHKEIIPATQPEHKLPAATFSDNITTTTTITTSTIEEEFSQRTNGDVKIRICASNASIDITTSEDDIQGGACCAFIDHNLIISYTLREVGTSRWAPWWLLACTRLGSSAMVLMTVIVHRHASYLVSQIVIYGYAASYVLLGIASILFKYYYSDTTTTTTIACWDTFATIVGIFHIVLVIFQAYLLVDVMRTLVQWEAWDFKYTYDSYLSGDFLSAMLIALYIVDSLVMQNRMRISIPYATLAYTLHIIVFTAVYAAGASRYNSNLQNHPAVAVGIWAALAAAYAALTAAVVGLSRLNPPTITKNRSSSAEEDNSSTSQTHESINIDSNNSSNKMEENNNNGRAATGCNEGEVSLDGGN